MKGADGCVLMLDFDGTLSPIAETPAKAHLSAKTKGLLAECSDRTDVVVISGRSLWDIKKKVNLNGLVYAGSHGMEWQIGPSIGNFRVPEKSKVMLRTIKQKLEALLPEFPGMLLEDKSMTLSIHYRKVGTSQVKRLKNKVMGAVGSLVGKGLSLIRGKKVFELRPGVDWTKGHFAEFIVRHLELGRKKKLLPFYVGDDTTDEDVFRRLPNAVTIRVGKKVKSAANYYLENQTQIDKFLEWMLENA